MTQLLQEVQYYDKYSRFDYDLGRRENWIDTVKRVTKYLFSFDTENVISPYEREEIFQAILNKEVMPSMRNLAMSGKAAARQNACSYNCAAHKIDDLRRFYETVIILMSGSGLGYSVEQRHINKLPVVAIKQSLSTYEYSIKDTTEGWAEAIYYGIKKWVLGIDVIFNFDAIRPAGSPLKVKGGRASGPEVLEQSLNDIRYTILNRQGKNLRSIDVHDIMCYIARCIVSGGTRRSAMICIFDLDDQLMLNCKSPGNIEGNEQRYLANNSIVLEDKIDLETLKYIMDTMFNSNAGEPGIFSRYAVKNTLPDRRNFDPDCIPNPCGEIVLKGDGQFCNLSSVVCRPDDTISFLYDKVRIATIIGTIQSMSEYFPNLRDSWGENQRLERLLGVDLNGIMDCAVIRDSGILSNLREYAIGINRAFAKKLGIEPSVAITCIKPSGNSSVFLDTSPGIHARWSDNYIRRVQLDTNNPILSVLQMYDVPTEPSNYLPNTFVAAFPVQAPEGAITNGTYSAIQQLENWKLFKKNWTEHNPSCTISYKPEEKYLILMWLYTNQDIISGLSFLPKSDAIYEQMPYEAISKGEYERLNQDFPEYVNWETLHSLEAGKGDNTNATMVAACSGDKCLI